MLQLKLICTNHHHESHREAVIKHTYLAPAACNRLECGCQSGGGGRCWLIWNIIIIISEPVRFLLSPRFQQMRARTTTQYEAYWQFCALDWCLGIDLLVASWVIAKLHHSINSFCSWLFLSKYIYSVIGSMNRFQYAYVFFWNWNENETNSNMFEQKCDSECTVMLIPPSSPVVHYGIGYYWHNWKCGSMLSERFVRVEIKLKLWLCADLIINKRIIVVNSVPTNNKTLMRWTAMCV